MKTQEQKREKVCVEALNGNETVDLSFSDSEDEEFDEIVPFLGRVDEPSMMVQAEQQVEDSDEGENSALLSPQPSTNKTPVRVTRTGTLLDSTEVFVPETPEQRDTFGTYFLEHNDSQSQRVPDTQISLQHGDNEDSDDAQRFY